MKNTAVIKEEKSLYMTVFSNNWRLVLLIFFLCCFLGFGFFFLDNSPQSAEVFHLMIRRRIIILMYQEVAGLTEVVRPFVKVSIHYSSSS